MCIESSPGLKINIASCTRLSTTNIQAKVLMYNVYFTIYPSPAECVCPSPTSSPVWMAVSLWPALKKSRSLSTTSESSLCWSSLLDSLRRRRSRWWKRGKDSSTSCNNRATLCCEWCPVIMPRCACVSEVYGSVFHAHRGIQCVCVSVCVECYGCSRINEVQVRVSIGF